MSSLNARVRISHESESEVARAFLAAHHIVAAAPPGAAPETRAARLFVRTREHLALTAAALAFSVVIGVPLGVLAARRRRAGQGILGVTGILQTIPSLALLVLFVPLVGIGSTPAVMAMVLYGLLPIVRNTFGGLTGIAPHLQDSARALGLSDGARLFRVELPLASPLILAGIQTSATISVGTATIGALIGAGGYGQSILTGIRLDDTALILEGAIPAAALALALQLVFVLVERALVPRGLRLR
jgi:osmoprotectant transport system permease protein